MDQFETCISELQQQYQTVGPFFLSEFFLVDGPKKLYNFLKSAYSPEFDNNFRIIVVQDCEDSYDYEDLPGQALTALQKSVSEIDISNSFIVVVSGNPQLKQELQQVQTLYSTDQWPMRDHVLKNVEYSKKINKQEAFCVLPWMHLYVGTDGNVLPCCQADNQFPMGNIMHKSLEEIYKSDGFNKLRYNMLSGQRSKECARCYTREDAGLQSFRIESNNRWNTVLREQLDQSGKIDQFQPVYLDIRLNNICNLKCRMCSGYYSSAIAQEETELFHSREIVNSTLHLKQRKENLEKILNYVPFAEKIYFAGGEPLLTSEHYDIMQKLIDSDNTDVEIHYNTNFTTLKYRDKNVLQLWNKFSNIKVGASLDAYGRVAEYVRHGCNWMTIETNLELLKQQCPHVNFIVTSTVGLLNVESLIELQKNWHTEQKLNISNFMLSVMTSPAHLTLTVLPATHKKRLQDLIEKHMLWCRQNGANKLAGQWQDVLTYMWSEDLSFRLEEFRRLTRLMDRYRNENLIKSIPELQDLL
jgi:radical SAM protein with 4Fe4S-binding SPASM domain